MNNNRAVLFALEVGTKGYKPEHLSSIQSQLDEMDDERIMASMDYLVHEVYAPEHPYVAQVFQHYQVEMPVFNRILDGGEQGE